MRKGPIHIPDDEPQGVTIITPVDDAPIDLPPKAVIDAGVAKFLELAKLNWPSQEGGFKLISFDMRNDRQLRVTLGLVFMAMREKEDGR